MRGVGRKREATTDDVVLHLMFYAVGYLLGVCVPRRRANWLAAPARILWSRSR